ncbi:hypothetical protein BGX34_008717 [Mortierella sp. NVP85]|nr:hypothetical protein BGX34_008717 [Mortierella sp. NVP85]
MRFILSVLLATAPMGTMATADIHHGQQTSFRLERRHHQGKVDHSHHYQSSSKKERREQIVDENAVLGLHSKKASGHHSKESHNQRKASHDHHKQSKRALSLHRRVSEHKKRSSHKKGFSHSKHNKRSTKELELHRKKANQSDHKENSLCNKHIKRDVQSSKTPAKTICLACQKAASLRNNKRADVNEDTELAFHRKLSRNRKFKVLGQGKNSNRHKNAKREYIKTQDIREKSGHKQYKVARKGLKAHKN